MCLHSCKMGNQAGPAVLGTPVSAKAQGHLGAGTIFFAWEQVHGAVSVKNWLAVHLYQGHLDTCRCVIYTGEKIKNCEGQEIQEATQNNNTSKPAKHCGFLGSLG